MYSTLDIQRRLKALGYNPGPLDGIMGRLTTAAIAAFQKAEGLAVKWPGTIGPKTIAALFGAPSAGKPPAVEPAVAFPWYALALRKKGLHEGRDYTALSQFLKSDGKTLGDPRQLPWCGDFVETCFAVSLPGEALPVNPYLARNWLKFGKAIKPTLGAVLVFWRGTPNGTSGHVGFAAGESAANYYVLGGNQSNAVTIAPIAKSRLLGARWPATVPTPRIHLPSASGGTVSTNEA